MPLETAADRLAYLEAFGVPATCAGGGTKVLFDEPTVDAVFDENVMNTTSPQCSGPSSVFRDLEIARAGARLTIETDEGRRDFVVRDPRPDGSGWTLLVLDDA